MCWICDTKTPATPSAHSAWAPRRAFLLAAASAAATPALAQVDVGNASGMRKLVPAEALEQASVQEYAQVLAKARAERKLVPANDPRTHRLHEVARRLIAHTTPWNERARNWQWQVNLISSDEINAWCMPGGKIAFYTGLLDKLKLTEDEIASVMGHEMAHALREHARERMAKTTATGVGLSVLSAALGLGDLGAIGADLGTQLLALKYSRDDEREADLVGLELAARAAYNPYASVSLWEKMSRADGGGGIAFLSTHPAGDDRIRMLKDNIPRVHGLYVEAANQRRNTQLRTPARGRNAPAPAHPPAAEPPGRFNTPIGQPLG